MKNNGHKIDKHFKKFMLEMLKSEGADFKYLRNFLNSDLYDNEGKSYLKLICQNKEHFSICSNLLYSLKELSTHKVRYSHSERNEVKYYLSHQNLILIKVDKEYVLMAEIFDFETMNFEKVRALSISEITERNKFEDMPSNHGKRYDF